jgi:hypothetical protein
LFFFRYRSNSTPGSWFLPSDLRQRAYRSRPRSLRGQVRGLAQPRLASIYSARAASAGLSESWKSVILHHSFTAGWVIKFLKIIVTFCTSS